MRQQTRHGTTRRKGGRDAGATDPAGLLASYHDALGQLFDAFSASERDYDRRRIAERICHLVSAQCDVDEELLYPEVARNTGWPDKRVRAAQIESAFVRKVVAQIRTHVDDARQDDRRFPATVEILRAYLSDYVDQQRRDLLPRLNRGDARLADLGRAMVVRRAEILAGSFAAGT